MGVQMVNNMLATSLFFFKQMDFEESHHTFFTI